MTGRQGLLVAIVLSVSCWGWRCGQTAGISWTALPVGRLRHAGTVHAGALAAGYSGSDPRNPRLATRALMGFHGRDPKGVRHVESRKQAMKASLFKMTLMKIFREREVRMQRMGDEEMMARVRIDDVIMTTGCKAAYIHIGAVGDELQKRQAFVWLVRNKGAVKTALARHFQPLGTLPQIYFVESQLDKWQVKFRQARKYPELNLPDPFAKVEGEFKEKKWKLWGMGDPDTPYPRRGFSQP